MRDNVYKASENEQSFPKVGLILPAPNTVTRFDLQRIIPLGISIYETRIHFGQVVPEQLQTMGDCTERAVIELATIPCDYIVYACTSGSFIGGIQTEKHISEKIRTFGNCAGITTTRAVIEAIHTFDVKKIAICTPYIDEVNDREKSFFSDLGFEVTNISGMGLLTPQEMIAMPLDKIYLAAKQTVTVDTELLFISCTGLHSTDVIEQLEQELGIPVIGSNQASAWAVVRGLGLSTVPNRFGSLFTHR